MKRFSFFAIAAAALSAFALAGSPSGHAAVAATPPPTPPPIGGPAVTPPPESALPTPSATFAPAPGGTPNPKGTPSPPPNARKGLDGVWEVQIQRPDSTEYTHFLLKQDGDQLTGTYLDAKSKKYPFVGTVDGQSVRLIVTLPDGTTILAEARLDGTTDMVGILTKAGEDVPFTATYRAKEKWIENVNPSPGGVPSQGGYTPP